MNDVEKVLNQIVTGKRALMVTADPVDDLLWGDVQGPFDVAVVDAQRRTGRELFRVLALVERLVAPGGLILLLPPGGDEGDDARPEATEVFCGAYPAWSRRLIEARVVELWKGGTREQEVEDVRRLRQKLGDEAREVTRALDEARSITGADGAVVSEEISDQSIRLDMNHSVAPTSRVAELKKEAPSFDAAMLGNPITFPTPDAQFDAAVLGQPMADELRKSAIPPLPPDAPKYLTREQLEQLGDTGRKKVVSLAVFGDSRAADEHWRRMPQYLACWVRAHHALFPGYELRIHHDDWLYQTNYGDVLHGLQRRGLVKLVRVAPDGIAIGATRAMLWRMAPAWDEDVSYFFCRDVDSLPSWRDRQACEEFITSGHVIGVLHDNPQHGQILGGLCHFDARKFRAALAGLPSDNVGGFDVTSFAGFMSEADYEWSEHGADQTYLNWITSHLVTPRDGIAVRALEHSLFTTEGEGGHRQHRSGPTIANADFRTEIAMPPPALVESIPLIVRQKSDSLVSYMGAAGFDTERALAFYSAYSSVAEEVREAERLVNGGAL